MDQMDKNPMKWVEEIRKYSERLSKKYLTQRFLLKFRSLINPMALTNPCNQPIFEIRFGALLIIHL